MLKNVLVTILFVSVIVVLPYAVQGGTVDIAYEGMGAAKVVSVWGGGLSGFHGYAGQYMFDKTGDTGEGSLWSNGLLGAFCIELSQEPSTSTLTYNVVMPEQAQNSTLGGSIGATKADYLQELWGRFYDPAWAASGVGGNCTSDQRTEAAAFSAAILEIVYEALPASPAKWNVTKDGTKGKLGFYITGAKATVTIANNWLHSLDGTGPMADLRALVNSQGQDYLVEVKRMETPEPATIVILGLGSVVLCIRKQLGR
jgi:hypothetical protein